MPRAWNRVFFLATLFLALLLGAANLYYGELNQDEGWYLYAARLVSQGHQPYRDFAFTQGAVLPYVYSLAQPLVDRFGVGGGRFFTALLGLTGALLAAALAGRLAPRGHRATAALLCLMLVLINVYQSYFSTVVKTYSLCGLLLTSGLLALVLAVERGSALLCFTSGILLVLSAGTRISAGIAGVVAFLYLLRRRDAVRYGWPALAGGVALAAIPVFLRWFLTAREGFLFGQFEYHAARAAGGAAQALVFKAGFVSRVVQAYFVAVALHVALVAWRALRPAGDAGAGDARLSAPIWGVVIAVSLVHFSAPFPYDDYQVAVYPIYGAALAAALVRVAAGHAADPRPALRWLTLSVFLLCAASAFSSPINQDWFVRGRDRIWWRLRERPALAQLREAADWVRRNVPPGERLLTQDTYLAVEAGRNVPVGLEMGPFGFYPHLDWKRARDLRVLSPERMGTLLQKTTAPAAALSDYSFAIGSPRVEELPRQVQDIYWKIVWQRYEPAGEIPHFGQGQTTLRLYTLRKP